MLVTQEIGGFGTDAFKQIALLTDARDIDIKCSCEPLFRDALVDGIQDHLVLLNDRDAAHAPIVGESFVLGGDQANDLAIAAFAQDLDPQMAVQQMIAAMIAFIPHHHRRLDDPHFTDRSHYLRVLDGFANLRRHLT